MCCHTCSIDRNMRVNVFGEGLAAAPRVAQAATRMPPEWWTLDTTGRVNTQAGPWQLLQKDGKLALLPPPPPMTTSLVCKSGNTSIRAHPNMLVQSGRVMPTPVGTQWQST